jgi:hypothetical protein
MSLNPYICNYFKFPIGHTTIHVGNACADKEEYLKMERLMKCTIVPPKDLYHPVLPFRHNQKLLFCLCWLCVFEHNTTNECRHFSDTERSLDGTWIIDEVYQYEVTQYDPETGDEGLFVEYINTFWNSRQRLMGILAGFKPPLMKIITFSSSLRAKACSWTKNR